MQGFRTYRHNDNPEEKLFHDTIIKEFGSNIQNIGLPNEHNYAEEHEEKIIISTIQWLGTPVGQGFLERLGYKKEDKLRLSN